MREQERENNKQYRIGLSILADSTKQNHWFIKWSRLFTMQSHYRTGLALQTWPSEAIDLLCELIELLSDLIDLLCKAAIELGLASKLDQTKHNKTIDFWDKIIDLPFKAAIGRGVPRSLD